MTLPENEMREPCGECRRCCDLKADRAWRSARFLRWQNKMLGKALADARWRLATEANIIEAESGTRAGKPLRQIIARIDRVTKALTRTRLAKGA